MLQRDVAVARLDVTVDEVIEQRRCEKVGGGLALREVDVLALTGPAAVVECREDRRCRELWRDVVGVGARRTCRRPVWPAGKLAKPGEVQAHRAEPGQ